MCDSSHENHHSGIKRLTVAEAVGTVLAHDVTEIRPGQFKGRAFKKGHIIRQEDVCHLQRLGKEHLVVLNISDEEMHEDDAAYALAEALMGEGVKINGEPKEGKITIVAERDGLLKVDREALLRFNMLGEVMCATLHSNTVVKQGQAVAGTRAIPLVVKKDVVGRAVEIAEGVKGKRGNGSGGSHFLEPSNAGTVKSYSGSGVIEVRELRRPRAGIVITGNEVYYGRIQDAFAPVITRKIQEYGGEIVGVYFAPDAEAVIEARMRELLEAGADLLITTGGMSVDPDDVTRFAIGRLGVTEITYGSAGLPGAMFLVAYIEKGTRGQVSKEPRKGEGHLPEPLSPRTLESSIAVLGIPACGMYHKTTVFDLMFPRVLAGERIGRRELAELGHGGLCLDCKECRYPVCPFGKT